MHIKPPRDLVHPSMPSPAKVNLPVKPSRGFASRLAGRETMPPALVVPYAAFPGFTEEMPPGSLMAARHCHHRLRQPPRSPITLPDFGRWSDRASSLGASSSLSRPRAWRQTPRHACRTAPLLSNFHTGRWRGQGVCALRCCSSPRISNLHRKRYERGRCATLQLLAHGAIYSDEVFFDRWVRCCRADCGRCSRGPCWISQHAHSEHGPHRLSPAGGYGVSRGRVRLLRGRRAGDD